ncbi:MAG: hypothetical protein ACXWKG_12880, partial [Limisphaerales bacterium]
MNTLAKRIGALFVAVLLLQSLCMACFAAPAATNSTPIEREVKQVMEDSRKAMSQLQSSFESKDEAVQKQAREKYQAMLKDSADKLLALSKKDPKDPGSVDALIMIVYMGRNTDAAKQALETLKRDHLNSSHI